MLSCILTKMAKHFQSSQEYKAAHPERQTW